MTGQPRPRTLIVKIGNAGDVYLDFKSATLEQLKAAIAELNQDGGFVTYYRESPFREATDAASATFQQLVDLKPRILLGTKAPSEWGRLDWVEVQRNPAVSRVFIARGQKFLFSPEARPERAKPVVLVGGPLQSENEERLLKEIDFLVRADRVLETRGVSVESAMDEKAMATPSLHLRLAYAARRWASAYPVDDVPTNIDSFYSDLMWFMDRSFNQAIDRGKRITGAEALEAVRETP